jgi:glycine/D-amino acid oxidase-like deaminating enzyme
MTLNRRRFIKTTSGVIAASTLPGLTHGHASGQSIGIVGGGIIGATIAYHLAKAGAKVTLFEKNVPASAATAGSFAWINTISGNPHYHKLRKQSVYAWHVLDLQLPLNVSWGGLLSWGNVDHENDNAFSELFSASDDPVYPKYFLSADEFQELEPNVSPRQFNTAMHIPMDGHVDAIHATNIYINAAKNLGADIVYPCKVTDLDFKGGQLSTAVTTQGQYQLDKIIIAGGIDTPELAEKVGFIPPLLHKPGILAKSSSTVPITDKVLFQIDPMLFVKQLPNGQFAAYDATYAPKDVPFHKEIIEKHVVMPDEIAVIHGQRIMDKVKDIIPRAADISFDNLVLAYRPFPEDGLPIVGYAPNSSSVYITVMHSGVTLSAIMGQYVTTEILDGPAVDMLNPYRPDRYTV